MQAAKLNGIVVHYADEGDATGLPVLFSNSLGTDLRVWDRLAARMPAGLRLIRYDNRGHGLTGGAAEPYRMETLADDAAALLDHLGVTGALVVGLSIGGMIAQSLAHRRPELVRAMVLMDTAARIATTEAWNQRIADVEKGGVECLADAVIKRWFSDRFLAEEAEEVALWRNMLTRTPDFAYIGCSAALRDADLTEATATLRLPTLAMGGDEDDSTPPDLVAATAALIPGARMEVLTGAGHLPCIEKPDEVAALIVGFMKENGLVG